MKKGCGTIWHLYNSIKVFRNKCTAFEFSLKQSSNHKSSESDKEVDTSSELQWTEVNAEEGESNISFLELWTKTHSINCYYTIDYFNLFFTTSLFQLFAIEINK